MKPVRFFRHVACESPGYLGDMLEQGGYPYELICLDEGIDVPRDLPGEFAAFGISGSPGSGLKRLFLSHPPLEERIAALQAGH